MFQISILLFTHLFLPAWFLFWLWKGKYKTKFDWLIRSLLVGTFFLYIFLSGRWDWVGYYFRYLWLLLFFIVLYKTYRGNRSATFYIRKDIKTWFFTGINIIVIVIFLLFSAFAISGYFYNEKPINLSFPLKNGIYYVGHGGSSPVINYHNIVTSQRFALDIVKLNIFGIRAEGILPETLTKYEIFGDTVYSPCNGIVIETENNLEDQIPPQINRENFKENRNNIAGNRVVILGDGYKILIAHMMKNSLMVSEGDTITTGQPVGRVGNTGNTSEPHLHIHAEKGGEEIPILTGEGIPVVFNGRFLVRNSLVFNQVGVNY